MGGRSGTDPKRGTHSIDFSQNFVMRLFAKQNQPALWQSLGGAHIGRMAHQLV